MLAPGDRTRPEQAFYMRQNVNGIVRMDLPGKLERSFAVPLDVTWIDNDYNPVGDASSRIVLHRDSLRVYPPGLRCLSFGQAESVSFNQALELRFEADQAPDSFHVELRLAYAADAQAAADPARWEPFLGRRPKFLAASMARGVVATPEPVRDNALEELLRKKNQELADELDAARKQLANRPVNIVYRSAPLVHVFQPVFENNVADFDTLDGNFEGLIADALQELDSVMAGGGDPDRIDALKNRLAVYSANFDNVGQLQDTAFLAYEQELKAKYGAVPDLDSLHELFGQDEDTLADLKRQAEEIIGKLKIAPRQAPDQEASFWGFSWCGGWWCWWWLLIIILLTIIYLQRRKIKKLEEAQEQALS